MFTLGKLVGDDNVVLSLPQDAATQKFAFLGQSGSGKSYGSGVFVEALLFHGRQVVIIDEVGIWYGLRLMEDGKTASPFAIPIFGGDHQDRPLEPHMGAQMAEALVSTGSSAILDVSAFTGGERAKFGAAFGETFLIAKKKHRSPVMLVLEEAQDWVPQRPMPEENRMKGAFVRITKLGRNYGIGITFISQRPQAVDKDALSQVECLVAFKVQEAHARKALIDWIAEKGEDVKSHVADLPKLPKGEALVWSPAWLQLYRRVKIGKKNTFDSSSTPAEVLAHTVVAPVSIDVFDSFFKEPEEACVKPGKPTALVHKALYDQVSVELESLKEQYDGLLADYEAKDQAIQSMNGAIQDRKQQLRPIVEKLSKVEQEIQAIRLELDIDTAAMPGGKSMNPDIVEDGPTVKADAVMDLRFVAEPPGGAVTRKFRYGPSEPHQVSKPKLRAGARRMLAALASYPSGLDTAQLRMLADLSKGGTFDTYMADLRRLVCIETRGDKHFATVIGRRMGGGLDVVIPKTPEAVLSMWKAKLRSGARRMFDEIVKRGQRGITREELIFKAQLTKGGTFDTYLADIRRTGCFEFGKGRGGVIRVRGDLSSLCAT